MVRFQLLVPGVLGALLSLSPPVPAAECLPLAPLFSKTYVQSNSKAINVNTWKIQQES